jgi:hypothetical protein
MANGRSGDLPPIRARSAPSILQDRVVTLRLEGSLTWHGRKRPELTPQNCGTSRNDSLLKVFSQHDFYERLPPRSDLRAYVKHIDRERRHETSPPTETSTGYVTSKLELAMKIIAPDAPNVRMVSRPSDSGPSFDLPLDVPPEIDQRDIEDLQILAQWYKSASIELAEIDSIFAEYDDLRSTFN